MYIFGQATHLAYPKIDENAVYSCTGNPMVWAPLCQELVLKVYVAMLFIAVVLNQPVDIENIVSLLLNNDITTAYRGLLIIFICICYHVIYGDILYILPRPRVLKDYTKTHK